LSATLPVESHPLRSAGTARRTQVRMTKS
jgi:hypothetical protein